jgi:hypothetical protein
MVRLIEGIKLCNPPDSKRGDRFRRDAWSQRKSLFFLSGASSLERSFSSAPPLLLILAGAKAARLCLTYAIRLREGESNDSRGEWGNSFLYRPSLRLFGSLYRHEEWHLDLTSLAYFVLFQGGSNDSNMRENGEKKKIFFSPNVFFEGGTTFYSDPSFSSTTPLLLIPVGAIDREYFFYVTYQTPRVAVDCWRSGERTEKKWGAPFMFTPTQVSPQRHLSY